MSHALTVSPLTEIQQQALQSLTRHSVGRVAERARMILLSNEGRIIGDIAAIFHCSENKVRRWIKRYQMYGEAGLYDYPRPGRPSTTKEAEANIVAH